MKKLYITASLAAGSVLSALAEGEAIETTTMNTADAQGVVKSATDGLVDLIDKCTPYITTLIIAGLAIWGAIVILKIVKRVFSKFC